MPSDVILETEGLTKEFRGFDSFRGPGRTETDILEALVEIIGG